MLGVKRKAAAKRAKTPLEKLHADAARRKLEDRFVIAWRAIGGAAATVEEWKHSYTHLPAGTIVRELTFREAGIAERDYRMDFACPRSCIAIEIDGGIWRAKGAHSGGAAIQRDREKDFLLFLAGWRVVRLTATMIDEAHLRAIMEAMV